MLEKSGAGQRSHGPDRGGDFAAHLVMDRPRGAKFRSGVQFGHIGVREASWHRVHRVGSAGLAVASGGASGKV